VTGGLDEVQAGVNSVIEYLLTVDLIFMFQIRIKSSFYVFKDRFPAKSSYKRPSDESIEGE
jgi:hypothetical protein